LNGNLQAANFGENIWQSRVSLLALCVQAGETLEAQEAQVASTYEVALRLIQVGSTGEAQVILNWSTPA
jgi:hypothetical protein